MRAFTTAGCLLTVTGSAIAQSGVATYSIAFGSATGPSSVVLEPGQSVAVFVNVSFSPGVGAGTPPSLGLSNGQFSIASSGDGGGSWAVDPVSSSPTYSLPTPWGGQASSAPMPPGFFDVGTSSAVGVDGVVWGFGFLLSAPHPYPQNPANVWRGTFTALIRGTVNTLFTSMSPTGIYKSAGIPTVTDYSSQAQPGQITIVPAPACGVVLALAGLLTARRRR